VLTELNSARQIKADLQYLLSHHEAIPALHEVHPRDLFVAGRAWRTFLLKIWATRSRKTPPRCRHYAAINKPRRA